MSDYQIQTDPSNYPTPFYLFDKTNYCRRDENFSTHDQAHDFLQRLINEEQASIEDNEIVLIDASSCPFALTNTQSIISNPPQKKTKKSWDGNERRHEQRRELTDRREDIRFDVTSNNRRTKHSRRAEDKVFEGSYDL
jgi:hypothetical protein